ncbi:MAG: hypothetical protein QY307_08010 [Acidimicrobiia bacterium]|nr:MAG: hypothetical protein QY307_08010 [Acidimicrobiia bacterium]
MGHRLAGLGLSVSGMDGGDGWFTLIGGVVLAAAGYMTFSGKSLPIWVGWLGLLIGAGVALLNFFDIMGTEGVSMGIGMWIMIAGAIAGLVGLLMGRKTA